MLVVGEKGELDFDFDIVGVNVVNLLQVEKVSGELGYESRCYVCIRVIANIRFVVSMCR